MWAWVFGWLGCSSTEPAPDPPAAAPVEAEVAEAAPAEATAAEATAAEVVRAPIPTAPHRADLAPVVLLGYGMRLELNAPFQALAGPPLIVSYWDVTAEGSGVDPNAGLHNVRVIPALPSDPEATFSASERVTDRGTQVVLQLGSDGTEVFLPVGISALGGMGVLSEGPRVSSWTLQSAGRSEPWPEGTMLHASDPATGAPFSFEQRPRKPWGPWPETP